MLFDIIFSFAISHRDHGIIHIMPWYAFIFSSIFTGCHDKAYHIYPVYELTKLIMTIQLCYVYTVFLACNTYANCFIGIIRVKYKLFVELYLWHFPLRQAMSTSWVLKNKATEGAYFIYSFKLEFPSIWKPFNLTKRFSNKIFLQHITEIILMLIYCVTIILYQLLVRFAGES